MKLTAVTVSVNYSDFLIHTIEANKKLLDRWIIVTDFKDHKTKKLCEEYDLECLQTNIFYEKGIFNKYAGINKALEWIEDGWVLFLDSDIVLMNEITRVLDQLHLNEQCIYGVDRLNVDGYDNWTRFKNSSGLLKENWLLHSAGLPIGARLVHLYGIHGENGKFGGYNPLGFFQLAHRSQFKRYPDETLGADHCDLVFAKQWHRSYRCLIPEMYVLHLESKGAGKAINWLGRKSAYFGEVIEEIVEEIIDDILDINIDDPPETGYETK